MDKEYEKLEKIGDGTYGKVYKVRDKVTGSKHALKRLLVNDAQDDRIPDTFLREIAMLKSIEHENVVKLYDVVDTGTKQYLVLEYLDMDLKTYMDSCPEVLKDPRLVKKFLYHILRALECCHAQQILHRDLKPRNVLIDCWSNSLKLADFGLSRKMSYMTCLDDISTSTPEVVGT